MAVSSPPPASPGPGSSETPQPSAPVNEPDRDVDADTARVTGATWETEPPNPSHE